MKSLSQQYPGAEDGSFRRFNTVWAASMTSFLERGQPRLKQIWSHSAISSSSALVRMSDDFRNERWGFFFNSQSVYLDTLHLIAALLNGNPALTSSKARNNLKYKLKNEEIIFTRNLTFLASISSNQLLVQRFHDRCRLRPHSNGCLSENLPSFSQN
jgi:hypothetical protein